MAKIRWDRLLETCLKRNAAVALLIVGSPPIILVGDAWRPLQVSPVEREDVAMLVAQLGEPDGRGEGHTYRFFWYGNVAFYHVMAFGYPDTTAVVVSRAKPSRPPPAEPSGRNSPTN